MAKATVRIELNPPGIEAELLRAPEVGEFCEQQGKVLAAAADAMSPAGSEYSVVRFQGRDRVRVHVATANPTAMLAEARQRALTRAYGLLGGR